MNNSRGDYIFHLCTCLMFKNVFYLKALNFGLEVFTYSLKKVQYEAQSILNNNEMEK